MSLLLQKSSILSGTVLSISGSKSESNRLLILKELYPNIDIVNLSSSDDTNVLCEALSTQSATIDIHPNPTKDVVYITTNLGDDETGILHIIDSKGQSVLESTIENNAELMLNVGNLNAGLYVVRISDTNGRLLHSEKLTIFGR